MNEEQTYIANLYTKLRELNFRGLGRLYIVAISIVVIVMLATQVLIQNFINSQQQDATVVNIAGRQRMLSQKITKVALQIIHPVENADLPSLQEELKQARSLWNDSHTKLKNSSFFTDGSLNSSKVNALYEEMSPFYIKILNASDSILNHQSSPEELKANLNTILSNESDYLNLMDKIVFQYNHEADQRVERLKDTELMLLLISLSIVAFELFFIFRPTARQVKETVQELEDSKAHTRKLLKETEGLYHSLGLAYQVLTDKEEEETPPPQLLAKADEKGNTFLQTDFFTNLMEYPQGERAVRNIKTWLIEEGYPKDFVENLWNIVLNKGVWNGEVKVTSLEGDFIWFDMNIIKVDNNGRTFILMVGADLTTQKEAEEVSKEINREKIDKEIRDQQIRSALIMQGQEEERKRISKDIHDGVGQLLTGLKFKLESVNLKHEKRAYQQIKEIKELVQGIISESRRIAFNLAPSSLSDYGIVSVLNKFAKEADRLSEYNVEFVNTTGFMNRLEPAVEVNVYRIVQEAVNNAIKYADGENIKILLEHDTRQITLSVIDDGIGFKLHEMEEDQKGLGLINMEERTNFINGEFKLRSTVGEGTKAELKVPLNGIISSMN
ncbi:sensor histidine kinase [Sediminitomix flava]|uniref:histidine kinase n=1 Tax=Sediminitomix flava TaxID=379075 RepID=A0A315ZZS1_SEDFL|nr:histidine kinase [Sediminitomix flava]PWJ42877.1 signal transduction histidine kinase [Sediminitomix flava]